MVHLIKRNNFEQSLLNASRQAYHGFHSRAVNAILNEETEFDLDSPLFYYEGKYKFHWSVFVHGLRRKDSTRRDRSVWNKRGICTPFEQLRRDMAKIGYYIILMYEEGKNVPMVKILTKYSIENEYKDLISIDHAGRRVFNGPAQHHLMNIVPF